MQWTLEVQKNTLLVRLAGEFDLGSADKLRRELDQTIEEAQIRHIIFNLSDTSYIDSSGLGVMLGRYKRIAQFGGKMAVVTPQPQVKRILELSGLLTIINEYHDEGEAMIQIG